MVRCPKTLMDRVPHGLENNESGFYHMDNNHIKIFTRKKCVSHKSKKKTTENQSIVLLEQKYRSRT